MKIQASIVGFSGKPATVYSLYDEASGLLIVNKESAYRVDRFGDCLIIGNTELPEREVMFDAEKFHDAVAMYFELSNCSMIEIQKNAARSSPDVNIEKDGVRESGEKIYRFGPDITNGQVAVLATSWYVKQARSIEKVLNMQSRLLAIQQGGMITI